MLVLLAVIAFILNVLVIASSVREKRVVTMSLMIYDGMVIGSLFAQ